MITAKDAKKLTKDAYDQKVKDLESGRPARLDQLYIKITDQANLGLSLLSESETTYLETQLLMPELGQNGYVVSWLANVMTIKW